MKTGLRRATAADAAALLPLYLDFFREDAIPTPARDVAANLAVMLEAPAPPIGWSRKTARSSPWRPDR